MKTISFFLLGMLLAVQDFGQNNMESARDYNVMLTTIASGNPPSITLKWDSIPAGFRISIYRKNPDSEDWGKATELPITSVEYTDFNIETGICYEYKIDILKINKRALNYVIAGINCIETDYRGKIILLVDSTFTSDLKFELTRFESDLIGDGWEVLRKDISRNASVKYVKTIIRNFYNTDPVNVNTVVLLGHIPVPYSGNFAFDGHDPEHTGAWPADVYYGDLNEDIWKDILVNATSSINPDNINVPGDGKFDIQELPINEKISLAVGRIDFFNLPAFPQSEATLLKNYLDKNHAFRHKMIEPKMQALIDNNFPVLKYTGYSEVLATSGWRNFTALLNSSNVKEGKLFTDTQNDSYIWSYACGGGKFDSCKYVGSTNCFVLQSPKTVFTGLYGSWFGDWNTQNNFMRAALASNGWILTSCWAGRPHYTFHQMGMGETIGYCVRATQNNYSIYDGGRTKKGIHQSLLGDPSLRMHIVKPVESLKASINPKNTVVLSWNPTEENIVGYNVYRLNTSTNKYTRITNSPVVNTYFEDAAPVAGTNYYMVRTLKLSEVASGSYYNLSQGVYDTVFYNQAPIADENNFPLKPENKQPESSMAVENQTQLVTFNSEITQVENEFLVYPNPSSGRFSVSFGNPAVREATISICDMQGRIVHMETFYNTNEEKFDISTFKSGIYIVRGNLDGKNFTSKINLQ